MPSLKNNKEIIKHPRTGKNIVISSRAFYKWQKIVTPFFEELRSKLEQQKVSLPIVRCKVKCLFYFSDSRRRDLSNKFETIADELKRHGIIIDDEFKVLKPIHLDGWFCKERPRTEIYLTIISPSDSEYSWEQ